MTSAINRNRSIKYSKDGAIMTTLRQPQIMVSKFTGFSTFYKNRQRNERIKDEWNRRNPRPGRPL